MSQPCAITTCKRTSRAMCYCCQQSLCLQHLKEHSDLLVSQLNPLVDQINHIGDQLKSIDTENKTHDCRRKLEQWRMDCHKKIDDFFEKKNQEINQQMTEKVEQQRKEINRIQSKIAELLHEEDVSRQDIDSITLNIQNLAEEVNKIEQTNFDIETRSVVIDDSWFHIEGFTMNRFDLSKLPSAYKTIHYTGKSWHSIASNEQYLLMHRLPDLCLVDRNFEIVRQTTTNYTEIRDMCWSSSLKRFILISEKDVFTIDDKTMSINELLKLSEQNWFCCTSSDTSLFLSTYTLATCIVEYSLLPSIKFIKEWKTPVTCQNKEWINDMKYSNGSIALMIKNTSGSTLFMELRNSKTFDRLWSFQTDWKDLSKTAFHCCLLTNDEWLIMNCDSARILHITKDGKIKSSDVYKSSPYRASTFGLNTIAISTNEGVHFHKL